MDFKKVVLSPERVWSRNEILRSPSPVPKEPGLYAWYFKNFPAIIPTENCVTYQDLTLFYIGISPKAPPQNGKPPSSQRLFHRIRYHMLGNAEGSTLRLTLGCLLSERLGIQLRRVGSGKRMTFATGEHKISEWLAENAFVTWVSHSKPWDLEADLLTQLSLPLNLEQNRQHGFHSVLSALRKAAKEDARKLPIV